MQGCGGDTLGHEMAHMFGCSHNREIVSNPTGTAFGKWVTGPTPADGSDPVEYHTVMA